MEAKDTVMNVDQITAKMFELLKEAIEQELDLDMPKEEAVARMLKKELEAQAEISFKAGMKHGIWLFAWWKDGVQYVGTSGRTLQEAYKELGIE